MPQEDRAMPGRERFREPVSIPPTADYLSQRTAAGWKLVALEWEREVEAAPVASVITEEIPYGLRVADDCHHLVEDPFEVDILMQALDLIVDDGPLSKVADELNQRGLRNREGRKWNAAGIFNLLPRMIEVGPRVFSSVEWISRRRRLSKVI
jgi:hypothetical protein